jgi:hypothetical protein
MSDDQMDEEGMKRLGKMIAEAMPKPTPEEEAKWAKQADDHAAWRLKRDEEIRLAVSLEIHKLRKDAAANIVEAERLGRLLEKYPDLLMHTTRGRTQYYYSKAVNGLVNKASFQHSCSCGSCQDSPLDVWLYVETPDGPVYSSPHKFCVGQQGPYGGDLPRKGWQTPLQEAGIPEPILDVVRAYFQKSAEEVRETLSQIYDGHETEDSEPAL